MAAVSGIDWADQWHDVHIADQAGTALAQRRFSHDEDGIDALLALLSEHDVTLAAIERPDGLLVGRLLAAGITVLAIHPNQAAAARERFRAAAGKSDRSTLRALRARAHRQSPLPALAPSSDETTALRALVRTREDLVEAGSRSPTSCAPSSTASGPAPPDLRRRRQPDRARLPRALPRPTRRAQPRRQAPARASSPATPTAAARPPTSCSSTCAAPRSRSSATSNTTPAAPPCSDSSPRCAHSSSRSAS